MDQQTQVFSMLSSISDDYFTHAVIPVAVCVVAIHFMFKHLFSMLWFSAKLVLSLLLYVQIRDVVLTFIEKDPLSIEYKLFGMPSGTLEFTKSIGVEVMKARVFSTMMMICPDWFALLMKNTNRPIEDIPPGNGEASSYDTWLELIQDSFTI